MKTTDETELTTLSDLAYRLERIAQAQDQVEQMQAVGYLLRDIREAVWVAHETESRLDTLERTMRRAV